MKMPVFLSEKSISLWKKIRLWDSTHRSSLAGVPSSHGDNAEKITFENFHKIFEYDNSEDVREAVRLENEFEKNQHSKNNANHSEDDASSPKNELVWRVSRRSIEEHVYVPERAYIKHITEEARKYGIEDCISIEEIPEGMSMSIGESESRYRVKYKITIKNLIVKVGETDISLTLNFDETKESKFGNPKEENPSMGLSDKGGILFVFESNSFVLSSPDTINHRLSWSLGKDRHLIFEKNEFKFIDMEITTKRKTLLCLIDNYFNDAPSNSHSGISIHGEPIMVLLEGNRFDNISLRIRGISDGEGGYNVIDDFWRFSSGKKDIARRMEEHANRDKFESSNKHIKDIENKVKEEGSKANIQDILKMLLYMDKKIIVTADDLDHWGISIVQLKDNSFFKLRIASHKCYFSGENIINNLGMNKDIRYLYWGPYQDIDSQSEHAHGHKKMFMELIERAVQNNDKFLEARLRKELLKCERALIQKERFWYSLQDRLILWWSSLVSDYGISWFRPLLGLFIINAVLAFIVVAFFFEPKYSWWFFLTEFKPEVSWRILLADWSVLFFQFFNPLSNLADVTGIKNNGWISFIHILQKAFLAALLYEMIKIFRRFSK